MPKKQQGGSQLANLDERKKALNELIAQAQEAVQNGDLEKAKQLKADIEVQKKEYEELTKIAEEFDGLEIIEDEVPETPEVPEVVEEVEEEPQTEEVEDVETEKEVVVAEVPKEEVPEELKDKEKEGAKRSMKILSNVEENQAVQGFAEYIKTKGAQRDNVKTDDVGVTIPEDVAYTPEKEVKTVQDLSQLVTKTQVKSGSGKHPIVKRATAKFSTVAELEKNPELAKPEFENVSWEVATYRGAIPVSEEAIQDSAVNLTQLIAENIQEQKINTLNDKIGAVLKTFTAKEVKTVDELKALVNVTLDPAYDRKIVCTQSFYQALDTLKDGNGRYLLQDSIINTAGNRVLGMDIVVVRDDLLGANGDAKAFIGDLKRGVFFADRADLSVTWQDHNIYGRYLMGAFRFDVKQADKNAGFFVTFAPAADGGLGA